jgi:prepilin-type N-terminal cleavage/methylation domain-containing protein
MTRRPARAAFTLIELLVVIFIITLISAVTVGVFGRVRAQQSKSATDATLSKINSLIERRWRAALDQVNDDVKVRHPGYAAVLAAVQNPDLAKALWTYAKLRNELPMSFDEARNPTPVYGGVTIPAKAVFAALPVGTPGGTPEESAVCLYLAVTANAGGGTAVDTDGLEQQVGPSGIGPFKAFKDAWGTPIAFVRTAYNTEVNSPPFIRAGAPFDPFDPRGKLPTLGGGLAAWWTAARPPVTWVAVPATYPAAVNHTWTAVSAGPNKQWWGPFGTPGPATDVFGLPPLPDSDTAKDNQLSYRLRREGARGD